MNNGYQLVQLQAVLDNLLLSSGLYLIDTDLTDDDIEWHIKREGKFSYYRGFLMQSGGSSVFESFVIRLSHECESEEIEKLRGLFFDGSPQRELIIQSVLALIIRCLSEKKKTIIHICGDFDLTSLAHEDLFILQEAIAKASNPIVIVNKKKAINPLIKTVSLKGIISMDRKRILHISYKHDTDYEIALKSIQTGLEKNNIPYSIDEYDIMYRDNIDDYEQEIGASDRVIMFVVAAYLRSMDCMFEMTQMFKNGNVRERIYPVVDMGGISRDGDGLKKIKDFWQEEKIRKSEQIKTEPGGSSFVMKEIEKIDDIILTLNAFWSFICRDFTGKYKKLIENDAALLIEEINKTWPKENGWIDDNFVPSDDTKPAGFREVIQNGSKAVYVENNTGTINIS